MDEHQKRALDDLCRACDELQTAQHRHKGEMSPGFRRAIDKVCESKKELVNALASEKPSDDA